jgi:hypothetical protein
MTPVWGGRWSGLALAVALGCGPFACGGAGSGGTGAAGGTGGAGGAGGASACLGMGFAASPIHWPLPAASNYTYRLNINDATGCPAYGVADLDGDGRPDLVLLSDCSTSSAVGADHWLVYLNTGSGFAASPLDWRLPAGPSATFRNGVSAQFNCPQYGVADLDGDRRPDLVVTSDCGVTASLGVDHWLVYRNVGTGFATMPTEWALPAGPSFTFNDTLARASACPVYATVDIDGDGLPDLVIADDCDASGTVGVDRWLVYLNDGARFAAAPQSWSLPGGLGATYRGIFSNPSGCPFYAFADFDGDRRPDIVIDYDCAMDTTVGLDHWLVHLNTGAGFAADATSWPLPAAPNFTFQVAITSTGGFPVYDATTDLDGDGRPDLVITNDGDTTDTVGVDHWLVHRSGAASFAGAPTSWPLPSGPPTGPMLSFRNGLADKTCPIYATTDFTGDGKPDLVFSYDCAPDSVVGVSEWLVYPNVCP